MRPQFHRSTTASMLRLSCLPIAIWPFRFALGSRAVGKLRKENGFAVSCKSGRSGCVAEFTPQMTLSPRSGKRICPFSPKLAREEYIDSNGGKQYIM